MHILNMSFELNPHLYTSESMIFSQENFKEMNI